MSFFSTTVLALSMSADAFAVSLGKGTGMERPHLGVAARTGAVFGATEAIMPLLGFLIGSAASGFVQSVDHWIAFAILAGVGGKMIVESFSGFSCEETVATLEAETKKGKSKGLCLLLLTAVGTSIDSLAVGVSLAFIEANIWATAAAIGFASFSMSTLGLMIGHYVGCKSGRWAEALGGAALIAIGAKILVEHLVA